MAVEEDIERVFKAFKNADDLAPQNCSNRLLLEIWKLRLPDKKSKAACDLLVKKLNALLAAATVSGASSKFRNRRDCPRYALARKDLYRKRNYGPYHTQAALDTYKFDIETAAYLRKRVRDQLNRLKKIRAQLRKAA